MDSVYGESVYDAIDLHSCELLIDGYSLLYRMHATHFRATHGCGNYDVLAAQIGDLFAKFASCRIRPLVLFDGGRDSLDRKLRTSLKRAHDRIGDMINLNAAAASSENGSVKKSNGYARKVNLQKLIDSGEYRIFSNSLPLSAFELFVDVLDKHSVPYYQCFFEADYDLACMANHLKCPVVSLDSDFLVYNLEYGYIPISHLDTDLLGDEDQFYMRCRIYYLDRFIEHFNSESDGAGVGKLRKDLLSVFAVLCGNDYVDSHTVFGSFLSTMEASNNNSTLRRRLRGSTKQKNTHFSRILDWLTQFNSVDECVSVLVRFCKKELTFKVREVVDESLQDYMLMKESKLVSHLKFIENRQRASPDDFSSFKIVAYSGAQLNTSFLCKFFNCDYSRIFLDVLIHRRVIFNCQIEVAEWPSSFLSSTSIRQLFYSRLIGVYDQGCCARDAHVEEYLRYRKDIKIFRVDLVEVPERLTTRFIFENLLDFDLDTIDNVESSPLRSEVKNLFCLIKFWMGLTYDEDELNWVKNENYKRAFIVAYMKLALIDTISLQKGTTQTCDFAKIYLKSDSASDSKSNFQINDDNYEYIRDLKIKINSYCPSFSSFSNSIKNVSGNKLEKFLNLKVVHVLSELQAIYLSFNYLRKIFDDKEFPLLKLNLFFNSTFLHNFIEELEHRVNPDLFIADFFGRKSVFKTIYTELVDLFDGLFS